MKAARAPLERVMRALRGDGEPWPANTDWNDVIAVAERHGVLVMLARKVPSDALRAAARPLTERAFVLTRQLRTLMQELNGANIEVLPIKGPVLAATAYGDPAFRGASGDLDLVVRARDFDRALERLMAAGYTRHEGAIDEHDHEQWESEAHLLPSRLPATMVELHTELIGNFHTAPVDLDAVLSRCRTMTLFGVPMPVTAAEDLLLYLCLHGSRHLWSRLLWVCDVDAVIRSEPQLDWDALLERAAAIDATQRVNLGLHLAHTLLGTPLPRWFRARRSLRWTSALVARRMDATAAGKPEPRLAMRFASEIAARETFAQRMTYLKKQLAPNARDRAWLPLPRRLDWMRVMLRPIRVLTRYGRGMESVAMAERCTLAIVIPTYGRVDSLRRLLDSIGAQSVAAAEVIVVDQNSSGLLDGVVPSFAEHVRLEEPNAALARNVGFLASRATHVTFIDDDEVLEPEHVRRLLDTFSARPHVRCIWPVVLDARKEHARRIASAPLFRIQRAGSGGVAFERELFRDLGGYDDLLFHFGGTAEDWELGLRMRRDGAEVWCDPALFVAHTAEEQGGCAIRAVRYEDARNRINRSTMLGLRLHGPELRLRLRDLPIIIRSALLSSLGRPDARRAVLRHPLRHIRMIASAMRESRDFVHAHVDRYAGRANHLDHAAAMMRDSVESRSA